MAAKPFRQRAIALLLALIACSAPVAAQSSWDPQTADAYPPPQAVVDAVDAMWAEGHVEAKGLVEIYNESRDPDAAFALDLLHRSEQYRKANHYYLALERLREYHPAATYAKLHWEAQQGNVTGQAAVELVLNLTDAQAVAAEAEAEALRADILAAQRDGLTVDELDYLLAAALMVTEGQNLLNQYPTFRDGLQEEGAWDDTLVQGAVSYSGGPLIYYDYARRLMDAAATRDEGAEVTEEDLEGLVEGVEAIREEHVVRSLKWYSETWVKTNDTGEHVYRLALYAGHNGTSAFNRFNNQFYDGKITLTEIAFRVRGAALRLAEDLDAEAANAGLEHPHQSLVADSALLTTRTYMNASQEQRREFTTIIPAQMGRVVEAITLLNYTQSLTVASDGDPDDDGVDPQGGGVPPGLVPALVAVVLLAGGAVAVAVTRRGRD